MSEEKLKGLQNYILKDLFCAVTEDEILRQENGKFYIGRHELPAMDVDNLIEEAKAIKAMYLPKLLFSELKYLSNRRVFEQSKDYLDTYFGKAMLYCIDLIEKKLTKLAAMEKVTKPTKPLTKKQSK
ncbi:MAG: hypothetical protein ACLGJB_17800 [Blastocatellia bacterium]